MLLVSPSPAGLESEPVWPVLRVVPWWVSLCSAYDVYCRLPSPQCGGKTPCDFHFGSVPCLSPGAQVYCTASEFGLEIQGSHLNRWYRWKKGFVRVKDLAHTKKKYQEKPIFTNLKKRFENIELPTKLLDYFLRSSKSNINQCAYFAGFKLLSRKSSWAMLALPSFLPKTWTRARRACGILSRAR